MTVNEKIKAFALDAVGCTYVYGATGQKCTPAYRKARAEQYPDSASAITKNCPVLSGRADSCAGCQYNGRKAYDCAQLTRYAAKAAGLDLPSGASSQWKKGDWAQKGPIETLPANQVCFLYIERDSADPMGHTGVYLGDGTAVDARGHSSGVVHWSADDVNWTHWAVLTGQEIVPEDEGIEKRKALYTVTGNRLALRAQPDTGAAVLLRIDNGVMAEGELVNADWVKITYAGRVGYCMAKYLEETVPIEEPPVEEQPEAEPTDAEKLATLWAWYKKQTGGAG